SRPGLFGYFWAKPKVTARFLATGTFWSFSQRTYRVARIPFMNVLPFANKSLGQHWLTDQGSLEAICAAAALTKDDVVLEIGPGVGALTQLLVQKAKQVVVVEFDEKLAAELPERVVADNLDIVRQDILKFDLTLLPAGYKIVANIPYYLTSNLIRVL